MASAWIEPRGKSYVVVWREPATGKRRSKGGFRRKTGPGGATEFRDRLRDQLNSGAYLSEAYRRVPLGEYAAALLAAQGNLQESSRLFQQSVLRTHIEPRLGGAALSSLTAGSIRGFFADLEAAGVGPGARTNVRLVLGKVLRQALREGLIPRNPMDGVKTVGRTQRAHDVDPLTHDEVSRLLDALSGPVRLMAALAAYGGFRAGELGALRREDVDVETGTIRIRSTLQKTASGPQRAAQPKTESSRRTVKLPGSVMTELTIYILAYAPTDKLFASASGGYVTTSHLSEAMRLGCLAAGIRRRRFHDLRHTHAAWLIRQGAHPKQIQARMGHSSISITMDVYGHLFPDHEDELVAALEESRAAVPAGGKVVSL